MSRTRRAVNWQVLERTGFTGTGGRIREAWSRLGSDFAWERRFRGRRPWPM